MISSQRDPVEELAEEFLAAVRQGDSVTVEDYVERHQQWAERIRDLFPTLLAIESLKPTESTADQWQQSLSEGVRRFGDFYIVREIGRGGMGVVYAALQRSLERRVALKVMASGQLNSASQVSRFQREARAAANLHHTNIIPVFGSGEQDGVHYYIMQYIEGRGLDEVLVDEATDEPHEHLLCGDWKRIATLGHQVASAMQYAHDQGVLHRDIKPANLILDTRGTVWVSDFGLAKATWQSEITSPGDAVGTLRYMAPEQIEGVTDERSDVYSLGLTLYELLVGRPAFEAADRGQLVQAICQQRPAAPRSIVAEIPRDLETIVLKAIHRCPQYRYQTADEMAADLQRYVDERPILARRTSATGRVACWTKRQPALAAMSLCLSLTLLLLMAAAGYASWQANEATARESELRAELAATRQRAAQAQFRADENLRLALQAIEEIARAPADDLESTQALEQSWPFYRDLAELNAAQSNSGDSILTSRPALP